nr:hypothetical protein [Tanacetum cinerariifolium]
MVVAQGNVCKVVVALVVQMMLNLVVRNLRASHMCGAILRVTLLTKGRLCGGLIGVVLTGLMLVVCGSLVSGVKKKVDAQMVVSAGFLETGEKIIAPVQYEVDQHDESFVNPLGWN